MRFQDHARTCTQHHWHSFMSRRVHATPVRPQCHLTHVDCPVGASPPLLLRQAGEEVVLDTVTDTAGEQLFFVSIVYNRHCGLSVRGEDALLVLTNLEIHGIGFGFFIFRLR